MEHITTDSEKVRGTVKGGNMAVNDVVETHAYGFKRQ